MAKCIIKAKDGSTISPSKAAEILKDGTIRGKKITDRQRRYFGYMSNRAENGATIEQISDNPYSSPIVQFNGPSHENGGIDIEYANQPVEVEGQETGFIDQEGALVVLGNLNVPGTKTKFKNVGKEIARAEVKTAKQLDKGMALINEADPYDQFERLKFNSGNIMAAGAQIKQKELSSVKEGLAALQQDMLDQANALGIKPEQLQKGKAKYGIKMAQEGGRYPWMRGIIPSGPSYVPPVGDPVVQSRTGKLSLAQRHNNPGNIMYYPNSGYQKQLGVTQGEPRYDNGKFIGYYAKFPTLEAGLKGMERQLFESPNYKNLSVDQAARRWVYGSQNAPQPGYQNIPADLQNVKISSLTPEQRRRVLDTFTIGEDSKKYNWDGTTPTPLTNPPSTAINLPEVEIVGRRTPPPITPNINFGPDPEVNVGAPYVPPVELIQPPAGVPSTTTTQQTTARLPFRNPLRFGQIAPEVLVIATERAQFVPGQRFDPNLYQPYQVSFQDRLNQNQSTFNAVSRQLGGNRNSAALSVLAAQKYQADSQILADEFRTNQGITNDVTNKNIALLNQAQLTNIELNDQQFVRQEQARANTRQNIRNAVQSISDKIQANQLENRTYNVYRNLFPQFDYDQSGQQVFVGNPDLQFNAPIDSGITPLTTQQTTRKR